MSFVDEFNALPLAGLADYSRQATLDCARVSLGRSRLGLRDFAALISPAAGELLETLCQRSQALTRQRFGRVIRLFAPLYLSNECVNNCKYCGFSRDNSILRVTLTVPEVLAEAQAIAAQGFRNILLVAGEQPKFIPVRYVTECIEALRPISPGISLEIGTLDVAEYRSLAQAGADGLVIYQETYDRPTYAQMHVSGPKRDFDWRLETPERAHAAGFRRVGIGALFGLSDWRAEALALAAHADYLQRHCWKSFLTISVPRLRPCAGEFQPPFPLCDRDMVQLICALRIMFPDVGLVLSTREPARLRDGLIPIGITMVSAGSHTEPGGYTGAGEQRLHRTERGRIADVPLGAEHVRANARLHAATGQFEIADSRPAVTVADQIRQLGYEPVWKDWDAAFTA